MYRCKKNYLWKIETDKKRRGGPIITFAAVLSKYHVPCVTNISFGCSHPHPPNPGSLRTEILVPYLEKLPALSLEDIFNVKKNLELPTTTTILTNIKF